PGLTGKTAAYTLICGICFMAFGVTKGSWRYVSISDLLAVIKAAVIAICIYTLGVFLVSRGENVPRSVPVFSTLFLIGGLSAVRLAYRLIMDGTWKGIGWQPSVPAERKVLLFGVSNAAESFIRSTRRNRDSGIMILGLFD